MVFYRYLPAFTLLSTLIDDECHSKSKALSSQKKMEQLKMVPRGLKLFEPRYETYKLVIVGGNIVVASHVLSLNERMIDANKNRVTY